MYNWLISFMSIRLLDTMLEYDRTINRLNFRHKDSIIGHFKHPNLMLNENMWEKYLRD